MTALSPAEGLARALEQNPESVFEAVTRFLLAADARDVALAAPVLSRAIPELAPMVGFDQKSPHHAYDLFTHTAHVVAAVPREPILRWTALLHDVGKIPCYTTDETGRGHFYGHAKVGGEMAEAILTRLKAPEALRLQAPNLIRRHMLDLEPRREALLKLEEEWGREDLRRLICLQQADMSSKGTVNRQELAVFEGLWAVMNTI